MKKLLSLLLCAALLTGAALPALAAEDSADAQLARVTQAVKSTLDLDTECYTSFHGERQEQTLATLWSLYWEGEEGSLAVSALEAGTIVEYRLDTPEAEPFSQNSLPAFPAGDPAEARASAQAFLDRVLDPTSESVTLEDPAAPDRLDSDSYRFSGSVLLHDLPSPLHYSLTVRAEDSTVTRFYRDVPETLFLGNVPSPVSRTDLDKASQALHDTLELRLEYVRLEEEDSAATLVYLPESSHRFYVDAQTGRLTDLTELERDMSTAGGGSNGDTAAPEAAPDKGLSEAEQEGIRKLEGVLSSDALDQKLRSVPAYGLDRYELVSAVFSLEEAPENPEKPAVHCVLRYSRSADAGVYSRTFVVDARTGAVQSLFSSRPWEEESSPALSQEQALRRAEAFLGEFCGERADHLALYQPEEAGEEAQAVYSFQFARQENGYFFPEHFYSLEIDGEDGSVCGLSFCYDEGVTFPLPEDLCTMEEALAIWAETYPVTLGYLLVPQTLDPSDPAALRLSQMGWTSYYTLRLGYTMDQEEAYQGVHAGTGELIRFDYTSSSDTLTYDDLEGHWARASIERLAQYRVGYEGGSFRPSQTLTQWDLVCLLFSLRYRPLDPANATPEERDTAYSAAYELGFLTRDQRSEEAILTRADLIRCLLDGAGYGPVARLDGIFTCSYPDRAAIPAADLGYAALAQGLGLVSGPWSGTRNATRGEAAALLCRLMER